MRANKGIILIDHYACYVVQNVIFLVPYSTMCYEVNKYISPHPFWLCHLHYTPPQISLIPGIKRYSNYAQPNIHDNHSLPHHTKGR